MQAFDFHEYDTIFNLNHGNEDNSFQILEKHNFDPQQLERMSNAADEPKKTMDDIRLIQEIFDKTNDLSTNSIYGLSDALAAQILPRMFCKLN